MTKGAYVGVLTDIPIYEEQTKTVPIAATNISNYFDVTNGTYYFEGKGFVFTSNNSGVSSSSATTTLTAKQDISALSFNYSYSSEASYDKFTLVVGGTTVERAVSGSTTNKSYSGSLTAGQTIQFTYTKDSSVNSNDDKCTFSLMEITVTVNEQIGIETKSVARKIKKGYVGVPQEATATFSVLEYIQSSRTQYIDTLYKPNPSTSMEAEILMDGTFTPTDYGDFFGSLDGSNSYSINFGAGSGEQLQLFPWLNKSYASGAAIERFYITDEILRNKNTLTVVNGSVTWGSVTKSVTQKTTTNGVSMFLFGLNYDSVARPFKSYNMRVFSWKIYDSGVLVRDYVPAKRNLDGAIGLYDRVDGKFYANAGTGSFAAGAETGETIVGTAVSLARKIKKAYIGVGGVARPCWSS